MVYCHQCENEWYRDEHGLTCPECQSDFTEIIEANHDPREDNMHIPADTPQHGHGDFYAPDPDEEDIETVGGGWRREGPGHYHATFNRTVNLGEGGQGQQQGQQGGGGGLLGALGSLFGGGDLQQQPQRRPQSPNADGRASSAPGAPRGGTSIRHVHGPGYHMTIATSSNMNLFPRDASRAQPLNGQPDQLQDMMQQMMMNIMGPRPGMMFHEDPMGGPPSPGQHFQGAQQPMPFGNIFQLLGGGLHGVGGPGGQFGDAVFGQEAFDRIMTQLMEQHQSGNAPGPAAEAAIKALPPKTLDAKDLGETGRGECSICMDEVLPGATVTELPCHHWFHGECIKAWLSEHDTCPHCRQGIMPKDGEGEGARRPDQTPRHDTHSPEYQQAQAMPGGFPFAGAGRNPGDGSRGNPFTVPDSPTMRRSSSVGAGGNAQRQMSGSARQSGAAGTSGTGGGVFSRMRDVFGGGHTNNGEGNSGTGS